MIVSESIGQILETSGYYRIFELITLIIGVSCILLISRYRNLLLTIDTTYHPVIGRINRFDALRGIAILGVVVIHSSFLLLSDPTNSYLDIWYLAVTNNISRFAIAAFFFCSGLLLRPFVWTKSEIGKFYWSKFIRIVVPYSIVSVLLWQIGYSEGSLGRLLVTGKAAIPLYFVPVLIQVYLLYPVLDLLRKRIPQLLFIGSFGLAIGWYLSGPYTLWGVVPAIPFLPFFIYGMVRQDLREQAPSGRWYELVWIYLGIIVLGGLGSIILRPSAQVYRSWYMYNDRFMFGFAGTFALLRIMPGLPRIESIFAWIGKRSLWIFLIHYPIQQSIVSSIWNPSLSIVVMHALITSATLIITIPIAWGCDRIYTKLTKIL